MSDSVKAKRHGHFLHPEVLAMELTHALLAPLVPLNIKINMKITRPVAPYMAILFDALFPSIRCPKCLAAVLFELNQRANCLPEAKKYLSGRITKAWARNLYGMDQVKISIVISVEPRSRNDPVLGIVVLPFLE